MRHKEKIEEKKFELTKEQVNAIYELLAHEFISHENLIVHEVLRLMYNFMKEME